jgi:hypothetical protein
LKQAYGVISYIDDEVIAEEKHGDLRCLKEKQEREERHQRLKQQVKLEHERFNADAESLSHEIPEVNNVNMKPTECLKMTEANC